MYQFIKKKRLLIFVLNLLLTASVPVSAKDLHYVNEHWPPYIILEDDKKSRGIDIEILTEITNRLDLNVKIEKCDWFYCLKMIENGRVDIISAALKRPDREVYMKFIEPPYISHSPKLFYLPKGHKNRIKQYEDIYSLDIGVLKGSSYFTPFDHDTKINKIEVLKTEQLLEMLRKGRVDAFIGTEIVTDYLIKAQSYEGYFETSVFRYESETPFHFAISKKSPFSERIDDFNSIMKDLVNEGFVKKIIDKYSKTSP